MGIKETLKATLESRRGQMAMTCLQMILAVYSSSTMISALIAVQSNSADIANNLDNWKLAPIVDVSFVNSSSSATTATTCPTAYPVLINAFSFPGVKEGLCSCPNGASRVVDGSTVFFESSTRACNSTESGNGCVDDPAIPSIPMPFWQDDILICGKRGGVGAVESTSPYKQRPQPTADTPCPSGYVRCGSQTDYGKSICFPSSVGKCPLTALLTVAASAYDPADYTNATVRQLSNGDWLVASRNQVTLPVVEFTTGLDKVCVGRSTAFPLTTASANLAGTVPVDDSCGSDRQDARYDVFSTYGETAFLSSNMDRNSAYCGATTSNEPAVTGFTGTCRSADTQCSTITSRNKCTKLKSYSTGAASINTMKVFSRREIMWTAGCTVSRKTVVENVDPLMSIVNFTTTVTVINVLTNVFGLLLYVNMMYNLCWGDSPCCPFEHEKERKLIKFLKRWVDTGAKLIRFIPLAMLAMQVFDARTFWKSVSALGCTDSTTQETFTFLSEKLGNAYLTYTLTLAGDAISLLLSIYTVLKALFCASVEDDEEESGDGTGPPKESEHLAGPV